MFSSRVAALSGLIGILAATVPAAAVAPSLPSPMVPSTAAGDRVLIRETDVITEDLYASGNSVVVRGTVEGDLVAAAFESVVVEGLVEGDVIALTPRLEISGEVGGSVRGLADQVVVSGRVGDDLVVAARTIDTSGAVNRDILSFAYQMTLTGQAVVGRDVQVQLIDLGRVAGEVGGDVEVNATRLVAADGTRIGGDLRYRAEAVLGDVQVDGVRIELGTVPTPIRVKTLLLLAGLLAVLAVLVMTFSLLWVAPTALEHAARAVVGWRFVAALGLGAAVVVVPLAVFSGLAIGAAVSSPDFVLLVLIVLLPFEVAWGAVVTMSLVAGYVPVAVAVGRRLVPARSVFLQVLTGLVVLGAAVLLPVVGLWLGVGVWLTGLGAWALGSWRARGSVWWRSPEPAA